MSPLIEILFIFQAHSNTIFYINPLWISAGSCRAWRVHCFLIELSLLGHGQLTLGPGLTHPLPPPHAVGGPRA